METDPFNDIVMRNILECTRRNDPVDVTPLARLVWFQTQMESHHVIDSPKHIDFIVVLILNNMITEAVNGLRRVVGLPEVIEGTKQDAEIDLKEGFSRQNRELEAWSLLYFRYVRVDLDFHIKDLASILSIDPRQISRRIDYGFRRLCEKLGQLESEAREQNRQAWLNLRLPPSSYAEFFGRKAEREQLLNALHGDSLPRLTTVQGMTGIGKTSLVHRVVRDAIRSEPHVDIIWISVPEFATYSDLLGMVAQTVGIMDVPFQQSLETSVHGYLLRNRTLLIVDAAHQLVDVEYMLAHVESIIGDGHVIVCIRQPLDGTFSVREVHLGPLEDSAYMSMLEEYVSNRQIKALPPTSLEKIYKHAEGNPLIGKLILNRTKILPLGDVLAMLPDLTVVQEARLFDTIFEPVWRSLSTEAQRLARLMCSMDAADLPALKQMSGLNDNQLSDVLEALVDGYFVEITYEPQRYHVGSMAVQFIESQDTHDESPPELQLQQQLSYASQTNSGAQAAAIIQNLAVSGQLSYEIFDSVSLLVRRSGIWHIWRNVLATIVEKTERGEIQIEDHTLSGVYYELGTVYRWLGEYESAEDLLSTAVDLTGELGEFDVQAQACFELGKLYQLGGQHLDAYEAYQRAGSVAIRLDNPDLYRSSLLGLIDLSLLLGDVHQSTEAVGKLLDTFQDEPDGAALTAQGRILMTQGRHEQAVGYLQQALVWFVEEGNLPEQARALLRLGVSQVEAGDSESAFENLQDAKYLLDGLSDLLGQARLLTNLGSLHSTHKQWEEALGCWKEALNLQKHLNDHEGIAYTLYNLADMCWHLGRIDEAQSLLSEAAALAESLSSTRLQQAIRVHPITTDS